MYRLLILDGHTSHVSLEFIQYCTDHKIIALCLPPHSTHVLQPLDVGVFSPLAKAYKTRIQQDSVFGAEKITNEQFLKFYQLARQEAISLRNIASAWRAAGLKPFNPSPILQKYRPRTPPFTSDRGQVQPDVAQEIDEIEAQLLRACPTPQRAKVHRLRDTCLTALADKHTLQFMNQGLVQKQQQARQKKTKKHFGAARVLTVEDALKRQEERRAKEEHVMHEKERSAALRGKVGFAKAVWKELRMEFDVFT